MERYVRISAEAVGPQNYRQLHFDVLLNEGERVADDEAIFGLQGSTNAKTRDCSPFVLFHDGQIDYGNVDTSTDVATMDVRSNPLKIGTVLELNYNGQSQPYRITHIVERGI